MPNFFLDLKTLEKLKTLWKLKTLTNLLLKGQLIESCLIECEIDKSMISHCRFLTTIRTFTFYYIHFEITGDPCNLTSSHRCDLLTNRTILCFRSNLFLSQWDSFTKQQQPIIFKACFKKQIKLQEDGRQHLQLFVSGRLNFGIPKKCNKVVIEFRVLQFWSEVILAISNHSRWELVQFWKHAYDFRLNCSSLSSITIMH